MITTDGLHVPDGYYIPQAGKVRLMCCQCPRHEIAHVEEDVHNCCWVPVRKYAEKGWNLRRTEHQPYRND